MITRAYFVYIVGHIQAGHVKGSTPVTSEIFQFRGLEKFGLLRLCLYPFYLIVRSLKILTLLTTIF